MYRSNLRVAIIGGGIGGLSAACALQRQGIVAQVFEQAHELGEVGAGVALSPNSVRLMNRLGLQPHLEKIGAPISAGSHYFHADGRPAATLPTASAADTDTVFCVLRSDLVSILSTQLPADSIHTGYRCVGFEQDDGSSRVSFENGEVIEADLVIGADGIHSVLQHFVASPPATHFSGSVAYRGVVNAATFPSWPLDRSMMWLGAGKHLLVYPVSAGQKLNYVAFVPTSDAMKESWSAPGDPEQLRREFTGWDPRATSILNEVTSTHRWGLYDREPVSRWSHGRLTLLGDAAHPMLPHLGQGANQSIEDGFALAWVLARTSLLHIERALRHYESVRIDRTAKIQRASRTTGRRFDSELNDLDARDAELTASASFRSWIRSYDVEADAELLTFQR